MTYVGITHNLDEARATHGNPPDWSTLTFETESKACQWEVKMRAKPDHTGGMIVAEPLQRDYYPSMPATPEEAHERKVKASRRIHGYTFTTSAK